MGSPLLDGVSNVLASVLGRVTADGPSTPSANPGTPTPPEPASRVADASTFAPASAPQRVDRPRSAFRLRNRTRSLATAETAASEAPVLSTLEGDSLRVRSFRFFFDAITSGEIGSAAELRARFDARYDKDDYLQVSDGSGALRDFQPARVVRGAERELRIDAPEVRETLIAWAERVATARDAAATLRTDLPGLEYFTAKVLNGDIRSESELRARFEGRFDRNGYLQVVGAAGASVDFQPPVVVRNQDERALRVTEPRFQEVLLTLVRELAGARAEQAEADSSRSTLAPYLELIGAGGIRSVEELLARLEARYDRSGYLQIEVEGRERDFAPAVVVTREAERPPRIEDPALRALVLGVGRAALAPETRQEIRAAFTSYLRTRDPRDLDRLDQVARSLDQAPSALACRGAITPIEALERRFTLRTDFARCVSRGDRLDALLQRLGQFEERDGDDRRLVANLAKVARATERARTLTAALGRALRPEQRLEALAPLARGDKGDREAAAVLAEVVCRNETLEARTNVLRALLSNSEGVTRAAELVKALPTRPTLGDVDYVALQGDLAATIAEFAGAIAANDRVDRATAVRRGFGSGIPESILESIRQLPGDSIQDVLVRQELLTEYRSFVSVQRPQDFDRIFAGAIAAEMAAEVQSAFVQPALGRNERAFRYMRELYSRTLFHLVESLRDDPRTRRRMEEVLTQRDRYRLSSQLLEKQRPLTDVERTYVDSVELLSVFNPYAVACAIAAPGVTREFLRQHATRLSQETLDSLPDGSYIPMLVGGGGPNGVNAIGEVVRLMPDLAALMLWVDRASELGGPFAAPRGPAWELNSANARGDGTFKLPDAPGPNELKTVRAYGSAVRWYPGERSERGGDARDGSINRTVDYLLAPDEISVARYPTNEDEATVVKLQASLLARRIALRTDIIDVRPNTGQVARGDKVATLATTLDSGEVVTRRIGFDATFGISGIGDEWFGFELKGSLAEAVLAATSESKGFPKLSTALNAFRALADRSREPTSPGEVVAIWGGGNTRDTLLEILGGIFQSNNPRVRDVVKVYVVAEMGVSERPRYAQLSDLQPRNGNGNLIERVPARLVDVAFDPDDPRPPQQRRMILIGVDGTPLRDAAGRVIKVDTGIAAPGFLEQTDQVFGAYLEPGQTFRKRANNAPVDFLTLPTNPDVPVADVLRADPNVVFAGTASRAAFVGAKLLQLPVRAREALLRNGVENAVAIGFRGPDVQAAMNIFLNSRDIELDPVEPTPLPRIPLLGDVRPGATVTIPSNLTETAIPNDVVSEGQLLSPLLSYLLANQIEVDPAESRGKCLRFAFSYSPADRCFRLEYQGDPEKDRLSSQFLGAMEHACADPCFQRYARSLIAGRRRDPRLELTVGFLANGRINPREVIVQEI